MLRFPIVITIDTNIFDSTQYDFSENSKLGILLKYVKEEKVKVVLSDIVLREVKAHAKERGEELFAKLNQNKTNIRKRLSDNILRTVDLGVYLDIPSEEELINKMETAINSYMDELCSEVIGLQEINLDEVIKDYFNYRFPFEKGKKRKEFPDAFIVNQIKNRFSDAASVVILSSDEGLIKACQKNGDYTIYKSLDDLFSQITAEEKRITDVKDLINRLDCLIDETLTRFVVENGDIEVVGVSYDYKGVSYGHDYLETNLYKIENVHHSIHVIDAIEEDYAIATLVLKADIEMDCYYKDVDNAAYDYEIKDFIFIDTIHVREKHHTNHVCRIKISLSDESVFVLPFCLRLGEDSRKDIIEINDDDYDEEDIVNEERENLGLQSFNKYDDYVEESVRNHKINKEIPQILDEYQTSCVVLEDLSLACDSFLENLKEDTDIAKTIDSLHSELDKYSFEYVRLPDDYTEDGVKDWVNSLIEICDIYDSIEVPETLELNNEYSIKGVGNSLKIGIGELDTKGLSEGDKRDTDIYVEDDYDKRSFGSIELTVGYMHFNDDMCATDGEDDEISINYLEIKEFVEKFVSQQEDIINEYRSIEEVLNSFYIE